MCVYVDACVDYVNQMEGKKSIECILNRLAEIAHLHPTKDPGSWHAYPTIH